MQSRENVMKNGFTFLEVLVATLIVMLGVTGYVTLQSKFIQSDSRMNLRTVALQIAQEKLDDLRVFTQLETETNIVAYNDIDSNTGGSLSAGNVLVSLTSDANSTYTFARSWAVIDQYFVDTNDDGTNDTWLNEGDEGLPENLPSYPAQKNIVVSVSWTDYQGEAQAVSVTGNVAPVNQGNSYTALNESTASTASPDVDYTPGTAPDVIAYDLGTGESVETSKPVPEVDNQGTNNVVQFQTVKYTNTDVEDIEKVEQEDFLTVNCECKLAGTGQGKTPAMPILVNGDTLQTQSGQFKSKTIGTVDGNGQNELCDECCRDHHDDDQMITDEEYYRSEGGSPHKHYKYSGGSYTLATSTGAAYDEVCRFKRVNGFFEVHTDWNLLDVIEFDDEYLFTEAYLSEYQAYSENLIKSGINGTTAPTRPTTRDITVATGGFQQISRGIYLDRMKSSHLAAVQAKLTAGDSDWKSITPFYDINLTLLSSWSTSNTGVATITNEDIQTIVDPATDFYGTYSRGRLEALADGSVAMSVSANPYNSGITGTTAISSDEATNVKTDNTMTVTVDSGASSINYYGIIADISCLITTTTTDACELNNSKKSDYVDLSALTITVSPAQFSCTVTVPKGNSTPYFSCENVSENWTGSLTFSIAPAGYTTQLSIQYPDSSVAVTDTLSFPTGLSATSTREYNLIINLSL